MLDTRSAHPPTEEPQITQMNADILFFVCGYLRYLRFLLSDAGS